MEVFGNFDYYSYVYFLTSAFALAASVAVAAAEVSCYLLSYLDTLVAVEKDYVVHSVDDGAAVADDHENGNEYDDYDVKDDDAAVADGERDENVDVDGIVSDDVGDDDDETRADYVVVVVVAVGCGDDDGPAIVVLVAGNGV